MRCRSREGGGPVKAQEGLSRPTLLTFLIEFLTITLSPVFPPPKVLFI